MHSTEMISNISRWKEAYGNVSCGYLRGEIIGDLTQSTLLIK